MDKGDLYEAFVKAGLSRLGKDIDALARPSIRLIANPVNGETLKPGASKLGGLPDLPADITWPVWNGVPQSFIAQIQLQEAHPYDVGKVLPETGMLWFFYDAKQETYGDDPAMRGAWSVFFQRAPSALKRATGPSGMPAYSLFKAAALSFKGEMTLSQLPELELANYDWSDEELQKYEDLQADLLPQDQRSFRHRLLGNPDLIQDDLRQQCQLIAHGVAGDNDPREKELEAGAKDWQLLLQIDTDERIGMRWASAGMLYYSITTSDLQVQRFDTTWLVLQSD